MASRARILKIPFDLLLGSNSASNFERHVSTYNSFIAEWMDAGQVHDHTKPQHQKVSVDKLNFTNSDWWPGRIIGWPNSIKYL